MLVNIFVLKYIQSLFHRRGGSSQFSVTVMPRQGSRKETFATPVNDYPHLYRSMSATYKYYSPSSLVLAIALLSSGLANLHHHEALYTSLFLAYACRICPWTTIYQSSTMGRSSRQRRLSRQQYILLLRIHNALFSWSSDPPIE